MTSDYQYYLDSISALTALQNEFKGTGNELDTTEQASALWITKNYRLLEVLFAKSWQCRKVVSFYPRRMAKSWGYLEYSDQELLVDLKPFYSKLKKQYTRGQIVANLYGQGFIIRLVDDGREIDEPIDFNNIKSIKYTRVYDTRDMESESRLNPDDEIDYYDPDYYEFSTSKTPYARVHKDRVIHFRGDFLPPQTFEENDYSYASTLETFLTTYYRNEQALSKIAEAIASFEVVDFAIEDLIEDLVNGTAEDRQATEKRYLDVQKQMSANRGIVRDKNKEQVEIKSRSFTNIDELIEKVFREEIVAASGLTKTQFMNEHPTGLGNTGKSQLIEDAARVLEMQEWQWRDHIDFDSGLVMAANKIYDGYLWHWNNSYQPTTEEQIDNNRKKAETVNLYIDALGKLNNPEYGLDPNTIEKITTLILQELGLETSANQGQTRQDSKPTQKFTTNGSLVFPSDYAPVELEDLQKVET